MTLDQPRPVTGRSRRPSAMTRERIRATTMAAEGPLHELGAIPITNSDSQGMGRIGETLRRTLQLAHVMKPWARRRAEHRQPARPALPRQVHHRARDHPWPLGPRRLTAARPARGHRAVEAGLAGREAGGRVQIGLPGVGRVRRGNAPLEWSEPRGSGRAGADRAWLRRPCR